MKSYYISGVAQNGEYEEIFGKIIEAKSKLMAHIELKNRLNDFKEIYIDQFYETTSDPKL